MKRFETINVIPFIDIMLVLLAIVLTSATFVVSSKLNIEVPESSSEETIGKEKVVEIAIDKESSIYFDEDKVDTDNLKQKLASLNKTTPINLRVDNSVNFGRFVEVLDLFKQLKLEKFSIITKQESGNSQ